MEDWFDPDVSNQAMRFGDLPSWAEDLAALVPRSFFPDEVASRDPLFNQIILNLYHPGDGILPHVDLARFQDGICVVSFGGPMVMHFTKEEEVGEQVLLEGGDLLVMYGPARYDWSHGIDAVRQEVYEGRVVERRERMSVTLRALVPNIELSEI